MNSERSVSQKHSTFIISVLFWRNTSELIRALTLDLQIKLLQLTFLTIYNQRRIPFILGSMACEWWLVREFLLEKASSETNRDTSAAGSELPHYCTATFCQAPHDKSTAMYQTNLNFCPTLITDPSQFVGQIQRDNSAGAWFVIPMVSTCQGLYVNRGCMVSGTRRRHQLWFICRKVSIPKPSHFRASCQRKGAWSSKI